MKNIFVTDEGISIRIKDVHSLKEILPIEVIDISFNEQHQKNALTSIDTTLSVTKSLFNAKQP